MRSIIVIRAMLVAAALASLLLYFNYHFPRDAFTRFDDAYMSLRYARHWLAGGGFSWNIEDGPSYGITSVMHLLAVTALRNTTDWSDHLVIAALSYAAGLAAVASLMAVGFGMLPHLRSTWAPLLVIPAIMLGAVFPYHSLTGMETTLALLFNSLFAASALGFARRPSAIRTALCLLTATLSLLTRPDMGLYCFLLPPLLLLAEDRNRWKAGAAYVGLFALLLAVQLVVNKRLFGDYLPLPFLVKSAGYHRGYLGTDLWNSGHMLFVFLHEALPFLLVIFVCACRAVFPHLVALLVPMALTFGYYDSLTQIMGYEGRFYYPSLPFLVLGAYIALDSWWEHRATSSSSTSPASLVRVCAALIGMIVLNAPLAKTAAAAFCRRSPTESPETFTFREYPSPRDARQLPIGALFQPFDELLRKLPRPITIAASEYGYVGARHPEIPIIDLVGLHDRRIAQQGFSVDYLLSREPDLIWLPHLDYAHLRQQILNSDAFAAQYEYYPYIYRHGVAIRKDAPFVAEIRTALAESFAQLHPGQQLADYKASEIPVADAP